MRINASDIQCKSDGDCKYYTECVDGKMRCVKGECRCIHFGIPGPPSPGFDDDKKVNNEVRCKSVRDCLNFLCLVGKQVCKNGVCKCVGHIGDENEGRGGIY